MRSEEDPDAIVIVLDGAEARLLVWALKHARPHARKRQRALMAELAEALVSGIDKAAADETNVEGACTPWPRSLPVRSRRCATPPAPG